jgi:hypothetical protein
MKKILLVAITASTLVLSVPLSIASADTPTPAQSTSPNSDEHHQGPREQIREGEHGFEGAGMFLVGGSVVIAIGLAFLIGRRSNKSR